MLPTLRKYAPDSIKLFLKNILTELNVEDFQRYYQCGTYLRNTYTSDAGTLKYKNFFSGFTPEQELKYHRWLNYILIRESFSKTAMMNVCNSGANMFHIVQMLIVYLQANAL